MSSSSTSTAPAERTEVHEDGCKKFVPKENNTKADEDLENRPGVLYPEILFYHLSRYIKPEQIGSFAGINRACYACTKRETFWRNLYKKYCQNRRRMPECLKIENNFEVYGLKQRVIRALFYTYNPFFKSAQCIPEDPHLLVGRRCVKVWFCELADCMYFKLKKLPSQIPDGDAGNMIEEPGCIDANPEEDCQVLQISCGGSVHELPVPPVLGMTLTKGSLALTQDYRYRRVDLGFSTSSHKISTDIPPEKSVVVDNAVDIHVFDWWHYRYPHFGIPCFVGWRRCGMESRAERNEC